MMRVALAVLCIGAVGFLLRVLVALVKESLRRTPRGAVGYMTTFCPSQQRRSTRLRSTRPGQLIVLNPELQTRKLLTRTGQRIALTALIASGLVLRLHGQQAATAPSATGNASNPQASGGAQQPVPQEVL